MTDSLGPKDQAEAIAQFRAQVIGPLLCRTFDSHGELAAAIRELALEPVAGRADVAPERRGLPGDGEVEGAFCRRACGGEVGVPRPGLLFGDAEAGRAIGEPGLARVWGHVWADDGRPGAGAGGQEEQDERGDAAGHGGDIEGGASGGKGGRFRAPSGRAWAMHGRSVAGDAGG